MAAQPTKLLPLASVRIGASQHQLISRHGRPVEFPLVTVEGDRLGLGEVPGDQAPGLSSVQLGDLDTGAFSVGIDPI